MTTENNSTLFEQFQDFVAGMPADQEIQNEGPDGLNSWDNCAIGLFAKSVGCSDYLSSFAKDVCDGKPHQLFEKLNCGKFTNYGELSEYIAWM